MGGHCDRQEGRSIEWRTIKALEQEGYTLVHYSHHNSHLVLSSVLETKHRLQEWVQGWTCSVCSRQWQLPYTSDSEGTYCRRCATQDRSSWQWGNSASWSGKSGKRKADSWNWSH